MEGVANAAFAAGMPAWDVKPRYDPGVLIGNWYEERRRYSKANIDHNSSYRTDYNPYSGISPDYLVRQNGVFLNSGVGKEHLFGHHGNKYSNNLITWYDQDYNKRSRRQSQLLPDQRDWKIGSHMAWIPERTDHPIYGEPTNWGLAQEKIGQWNKDRCQSANSPGKTDFTTTYKYMYGKVPEQTRVNRFYIGKSLNKQKSTVLPLSDKTVSALSVAS